MEPITISIADTCKAVGVGRTTVWRLIRRGDLDTIKIGDRRLVTTDSIQRLVQRSAA